MHGKIQAIKEKNKSRYRLVHTAVHDPRGRRMVTIPIPNPTRADYRYPDAIGVDGNADLVDGDSHGHLLLGDSLARPTLDDQTYSSLHMRSRI